MQCELKKSENRLFEWAALARDLLNVDTLDQVRHKIEDMRKEELKLRDDLGNLTLELNSFNRYHTFDNRVELFFFLTVGF